MSLPFCADPFPVVLEQLDGVLADVAVRLDRRHGGDDDDVAGRGSAASRIIRSMAAALSASITFAKSLTGAVSSGRDGGWAAVEAGCEHASASTSATTRRTPTTERRTPTPIDHDAIMPRVHPST